MDIKNNKSIKELIKKAKKDSKVIAVALFGSHSRDEQRKDSDIDICIFLDKKYSNLEMFNKRLGFLRDVSDKFDIQIFQQLPVYIRMRILKEHKILLVKNEDLLYEFAFDTIKEFGFYKKIYYMYLEEIKNGPRKNTLKI